MEDIGKTKKELLNELREIRQRLRELENRHTASIQQRDTVPVCEHGRCPLLDSLPDPAVVYDVDGRVQYLNPSFEEKFGWSLHDVVGQRMPFVPESKEDETAILVGALLKKGKVCRALETQRLTRSGDVINVSLSASRYELFDGGPKRVAAIHRDITGWKKTQADLGAELDHFQKLYALAVGMSADRSLQENLHSVVESSRSVLDTDLAYIALRDSKSGLRLKEFTGLKTELFKTARISLRTGIAGQVVKEGRGIIVRDYFASTGRSPLDLKKYRAEGLISVLAAPVRIGGHILGVLYAANRHETTFTHRELQTLELLANLAAIEVARKQDQEKLENELERFKQLYAVAKEMGAERKLIQKLQLIVRKCKSLFDVDAASLSVRRGALRIGAVRETVGCLTADFRDLVTPDNVGTPEILLRTGKGVATRNYFEDGRIKQDPRVTGILEKEGIVSCMVVPIMTGSTHLGRLGLHRRKESVFTSEEMKTLQLFANLAALEVTRAEAMEKLEALHEVALNMTADRPLEEKLGIVAKKAMELMHTDLSYVSIVDRDAGTVEAFAAAGVRTEAFKGLKTDIGGGMGGKAERTGEVQACEDYFEEYRPEEEVATVCREEGVASAIVAPVIMRGTPVGRLWAINRNKTKFDSSRLDPMRHLSNLSAIEVAYHRAMQSLERSRDEAESLVQKRTLELQNELDRFRALYDVAISMTASLSLEDKLTKVVEETRSFLKTDTSYIALRDEQDPEAFYLYSFSGIRTEKFQECRIRLGEGIAGEVGRTGKGLIVADYLNSEMNIPPSSYEEAKKEGLRSVMAAPVITGGEVLGVLYVSNRRVTNFAESELQTLELFGNIAAVEIGRRNQEIRRLHEEKERRKTEEKLRLIADHLPVLIAYVNSEERYEFVNWMFGRLYGREMDTIIGMSVKELVGEHVYLSHLRDDIHSALSGAEAGRQYLVPDQNRNERHWRSIFIPHTEDDKTIGFAALVQETTEQEMYKKKLRKAKEDCEEEVKERTKELQSSQATLKTLLPKLLHEVRAPLREVERRLKDVGESLERTKGDQAKAVIEATMNERPSARALWRQVVTSLETLVEITHQLQPLYRACNELQTALQSEHLGPLRVVLEMDKIVREEIQSLGLTQFVRIPEPLPRVRADESCIRVITRHLLENSKKYAHPHRELLIEITAAKEGEVRGLPDRHTSIDELEETTFHFSDNGRGMSEDDQEHACSLGWRKDTGGSGGGLGLYLCKTMVLQHGGEFGCESQLGQWTKFWFTIPDQ